MAVGALRCRVQWTLATPWLSVVYPVPLAGAPKEVRPPREAGGYRSADNPWKTIGHLFYLMDGEIA